MKKLLVFLSVICIAFSSCSKINPTGTIQKSYWKGTSSFFTMLVAFDELSEDDKDDYPLIPNAKSYTNTIEIDLLNERIDDKAEGIAYISGDKIHAVYPESLVSTYPKEFTVNGNQLLCSYLNEIIVLEEINQQEYNAILYGN